MTEIERYLLNKKPVECQLCKGKLFYVGGGQYRCIKCDNIELDDLGKIKKLLEEQGPLPFFLISEMTGISIEIIEILLKEGQITITDDSKYFLKCGKCGCSIRSGRFCVDCAKELAQGVQKVFYNEAGEKARMDVKAKEDVKPKMHFFCTRK